MSLSSSLNEKYFRSCSENQNTILCLITFFRKFCRLWDNSEKYLERDSPQMTIWRMLDTQVYKHTLRICNIHCFPTATVVARTRLNVRSYVHYLSGLSSQKYKDLLSALAALSLEGKAVAAWIWPPQPSAEFKNRWSYTSAPPCLCCTQGQLYL